MAQTTAVTGQPVVNDGGTVKKATAISGPITSVRTLRDDAVTTSYGSKVALSSGLSGSSGNLGTFNAFTNFAYQQIAGEYVMKKRTNFVNGIADTLMTSCASSSSERMRSIPFLETARQLGSGILTSWDYETGAITKGANAGDASNFGTDDAAHPSNAVPGELAYKTSKALPVTDEYKPKTAP